MSSNDPPEQITDNGNILHPMKLITKEKGSSANPYSLP